MPEWYNCARNINEKADFLWNIVDIDRWLQSAGAGGGCRTNPYLGTHSHTDGGCHIHAPYPNTYLGSSRDRTY